MPLSTRLRLAAAALLLLPLLAQAVTRPKIGAPPPDELGKDQLGEPVRVSDHRGKVVIVTFWASWCGPCRRELPILGKLQHTVGREHMEVVAINWNEPRRDYQAVIRANKGIALTYVHDKGRVADAFGVTAVPHMLIIDTEGNIAHRHVGYTEEMIKDLVAEIIALLPAEALARPAPAAGP